MMANPLRRARFAVAALLVVAVAGCEARDPAGPTITGVCSPLTPGALAAGITLEPHVVRIALTDLAQRVAPSFGSEGMALASRMRALSEVWPARTEMTCALYHEARVALSRVAVVPETSPDRALVAFILDAVGSMLPFR
ncbi:MAG TPA: hypothetical protein VNZ57_08980 [Longimicrobiales bacterium]|nr:hypothetical protein [Longimicrobiales bacterium]